VESDVNPTLGWSWSGLALGPVALIQHGLWRVFFFGLLTVAATSALIMLAMSLPGASETRSALPVVLLVLLFIFHLLVATSLSRWRMHRQLRQRMAQKTVITTSTSTAELITEPDLNFVRQRATLERSVNTPPSPAVDTDPDTVVKTFYGLDATSSEMQSAPTCDQLESAPDHYFAQALDELRAGENSPEFERDETVWQQASLAHADNENLARSLYIRLRVARLLESEADPRSSGVGRNLFRASSRRLARLRAYESYIEKVCFRLETKPGRESVDALAGLQSASTATYWVAELNEFLPRIGLSIDATTTGGYTIRGSDIGSLTIEDPDQLEEFLQILLQNVN